METVFENEFAKLSYESDIKTLTITWTNERLSFEDYKLPFEKALECIKENKVENYISDIREQAIISPEYRKWLQDEALPEAASNGLKRVVGVANVNIFKKYYINNVFQSAKKFGVDFKMFNTLDEAYKWFKSFD